MILEKRQVNISKYIISKSITATQKRKKNLAEIFDIFECQLIKIPHVSWFFQYGRILKNPKIGGSRKLFLLEHDFETFST